jgi:DNA-directed RNA polymerase
VLREQFVQLYSRDHLRDFLNQAKAQLPEELWDELPEPMERGTLDLEGVMDATYFFAP